MYLPWMMIFTYQSNQHYTAIRSVISLQGAKVMINKSLTVRAPQYRDFKCFKCSRLSCFFVRFNKTEPRPRDFYRSAGEVHNKNPLRKFPLIQCQGLQRTKLPIHISTSTRVQCQNRYDIWRTIYRFQFVEIIILGRDSESQVERPRGVRNTNKNLSLYT